MRAPAGHLEGLLLDFGPKAVLKKRQWNRLP